MIGASLCVRAHTQALELRMDVSLSAPLQRAVWSVRVREQECVCRLCQHHSLCSAVRVGNSTTARDLTAPDVVAVNAESRAAAACAFVQCVVAQFIADSVCAQQAVAVGETAPCDMPAGPSHMHFSVRPGLSWIQMYFLPEA
jgi:hypothetical protein